MKTSRILRIMLLLICLAVDDSILRAQTLDVVWNLNENPTNYNGTIQNSLFSGKINLSSISFNGFSDQHTRRRFNTSPSAPCILEEDVFNLVGEPTGSSDIWPNNSNINVNNNYLEFTITPIAGTSLNYTNIYIEIGQRNYDSPFGNAGPRKFLVRDLTTSTTSNLFADVSPANNQGIINMPTTTAPSTGITLLFPSSYSNVTTSRTFRIYPFDGNIKNYQCGSQTYYTNGFVLAKIGFDFVDPVVLPIIFTQLKASLVQFSTIQAPYISLGFHLFNDEPITKLQVERSIDGVRFQYLKTISLDNVFNNKTFNVIDESLPASAPLLHYRLAAADKDGKWQYSNIVQVATDPQQFSALFPSLLNRGQTAQLQVKGLAGEGYDWEISAMTGIAYLKGKGYLTGINNLIPITLDQLPKGQYVFTVTKQGKRNKHRITLF